MSRRFGFVPDIYLPISSLYRNCLEQDFLDTDTGEHDRIS